MDHIRETTLPERGQVPNLRLVKHVLPGEVALPLVNNPSSTCTYVNDISSTTVGGIMEEMVAYPLPTIQIPPKSCHFAREKGGFLFFFAHNGMNDFDLVKEVTHGYHRLLPLTKAFGVGVSPRTFIL
jgi:hypothetical protein